MFEPTWTRHRVTVGVQGVWSRRYGWHTRTGLASDGRTLAGLDITSMTADDAIAVLVAVQDLRAELDVLEADLLARAAGATAVHRDVLLDGRRVRMTDEVVDEIAAGLSRSCTTVAREVHLARLLQGPLARTRAEVASGRISMSHAQAIAEQAHRMATTANMDNDQDRTRFEQACGRLQDRVLPHAPSLTPGQTRSRARRAVAVIDRAAEERRRRSARRGCDVRGYGIDDGLAVIEARIPAVDAAAVLARLDATVRRLIADGTVDDLDWRERHGLSCDPALGQIRVAAYLDLLRANSSASTASASIEFQVVVDAATLAGLDPDGAAWVKVGCGEPTAVGRTELLSLLKEPTCDVTMRRLVTDPATGALIDRGRHAYAVSDALVAWITARDVTCRFPGCSRRAEACDVDHARSFAEGGLTTIGNAGAMCRRHHNCKTHGGWQVIDARPDGSCVFVSPRGYRYRHHPVELIPRPSPAAAESPPTPHAESPPPF